MNSLISYPRATQSWHSIAPKIGVVKNILALGCSFLCAHSATLLPFRTYLVISEDLKLFGPVLFAIFYALATISCLYGPWIGRKFTYKICITLCHLPVALVVGAVAYNHYYTLLPTIVFVGLLQGPLWNSAIAYLVNMAAQYSYFSYKTQDAMVRRFLSLYNCLISCGFFAGHLLTAGAFSAELELQNRTDAETWKIYGKSGKCGRLFCNPRILLTMPAFGHTVTNFTAAWRFLRFLPELSQVVPVYFVTLCAGLVLGGVLMALFPLGKLTVQLCAQTQKSAKAKELFADLMISFQSRPLALMAPLFFVRGIGEAFLVCDVMKAYVACIATHSAVGYVLFCAGCVAAFLHLFLSSVLRHINRLSVFGAAGIIQIGSTAVMVLWKPVSDDQAILYVIAASWTMADTIWLALCQSVYRNFPERWEAPFAAFFMSSSLGMSVGFAFCPYGCFQYKLYIYTALYFGATIPFALTEYKFQALHKLLQ